MYDKVFKVLPGRRVLQLQYCELGILFAGSATFQDGGCHDYLHEEKASVMKIACDIFGYDDEECELVS